MSEFTKFFSLGRVQLKSDLVYRMDFLFSLIVTPILLFVNYFIWKAVYSANPGQIAGFTFSGMMGYFVYSQLISIAIYNSAVIELQQKVQSGDFGGDLTKPVHPFMVLFSGAVASRIVAIFLEIIPLAILSWWLFRPLIPHGVMLVLFLLSCALAFFLNFLLSFILGLLSFWTIRVEAFQWLSWIVLRLFSGEFFPLTLLPKWAQTVSHLLPFEYLRFRVAEVAATGAGASAALSAIAGQVVWIVLMGLFSAWLWSRVLRRFAQAGG